MDRPELPARKPLSKQALAAQEAQSSQSYGGQYQHDLPPPYTETDIDATPSLAPPLPPPSALDSHTLPREPSYNTQNSTGVGGPAHRYGSSSSVSSQDLDTSLSRLSFGSPQTRLNTRESSSGRLQKPIAIPTVRKSIEAPFLRAYPPVLESYGIPREVFIRHLDNLNNVKIGAPPLQILDAAAGIVGFVPESTVQTVSGIVSLAAQVGHHTITRGGTELKLWNLNREVFEPRGLKVEIAKLRALCQIAGFDHILNDKGKVDKRVRLLDLLADVEGADEMSMQERRLAALEPWIAHLDVVQEKQETSNILKKFNSNVGAMKDAKEEKATQKRRRKASEDHAEEMTKAQNVLDKELKKLEKEERKIREECADKPDRLEKRLAKLQMDEAKLYRKFDKATRKADKDKDKDSGKKESKSLQDISFLVIRNLDADSGSGKNPVL